MTKPRIILIGAGGHCRACIDVIEQEDRFDIVGIVDKESPGLKTSILGYPLIGMDDDLPALKKECGHALVTVGQIKSVAVRIRIFNHLVELGFELPTIISPLAYVSRHAKIGQGTVVMHQAVVNANALVGSNCILNTRCLIEHESVVGNHVHVSTGAVINGNANIGNNSFVGSGAIVIHGVALPDRSFVRAGQLVISDKDCRIQEQD